MFYARYTTALLPPHPRSFILAQLKSRQLLRQSRNFFDHEFSDFYGDLDEAADRAEWGCHQIRSRLTHHIPFQLKRKQAEVFIRIHWPLREPGGGRLVYTKWQLCWVWRRREERTTEWWEEFYELEERDSG